MSDIATRLRELADLRAGATEGPWWPSGDNPDDVVIWGPSVKHAAAHPTASLDCERRLMGGGR